MKNNIPPGAVVLASGLNRKNLSPDVLLRWMSRPRNPIFASADPLAKMFIKAMVKGHVVNFIYCGGSSPGAARTINVSLVFQHEPQGRIYIAGYCPERGGNRIFALDLVMVIHARN